VKDKAPIPLIEVHPGLGVPALGYVNPFVFDSFMAQSFWNRIRDHNAIAVTGVGHSGLTGLADVLDDCPIGAWFLLMNCTVLSSAGFGIERAPTGDPGKIARIIFIAGGSGLETRWSSSIHRVWRV
jgi:hypothetical protein